MYPVVFFDALRVKIREDNVVRSKAVYLALGVLPDGSKDILGIWIENTEGAKFWMKVFNDLKTRGCNDILIAVTDGLKGMPEALGTVYPATTLQTCIVHLIRKIVDAAQLARAAAHAQASLVTDALRMAWFRRHPAPGLIFHSDRGSQYRSDSFQDTLRSYGMRSSMSCKGNCWDNAPTESLWGSLKVGRLYGKKFATQRQAMNEVIDWLTFYNHRRLHSTLGYVSPIRFEANWHAGQSKQAA
jgi:hypothetical protein